MSKPSDKSSIKKPSASKLASLLVPWYQTVRRTLPWRTSRDPYPIWISEVMLQQTTVAAVIPFYERFLKRFPTLHSLAEAPVEHVLEHWAGLGYYSRARNLHKSALALKEQGAKNPMLKESGGFPKSHRELLELPGFGDYTSRAVSSLAFGERVGVVDGNVIRVLSRVYDVGLEFWKPKVRDEYQRMADAIINADPTLDPSDLNQALMELGATVCTPQSPACLICPWNKQCLARANDTIALRPLPKPRREPEVWNWQPVVYARTTKTEAGEKRREVLLIENNYAPFLKGHWIWPGEVVKLKKKPADYHTAYHFMGVVTHHQIYVKVGTAKAGTKAPKGRWVAIDDLKSAVPSSLVRKALDELAKS